MNGEKTVLICENSMEGIFTAVYDGWLDGTGNHEVEVRTCMPDNLELFCTYRAIETDQVKAGKVMRTILMKLGTEIYEYICYAAVSLHPDRGTAIYRVLRKALGHGRCNTRVMEALADPDVCLVAKLRTKVWHEFHRYLGFVRFYEVGGGVLFSRIRPENDILAMLGPHFSNRFPNENWMIYDEGRETVLLHPKRGECSLRSGVTLSEEYRETLSNTEEYEELWRCFCKSITIQERTNGMLPQQFLPLKFRKNMTEFT